MNLSSLSGILPWNRSKKATAEEIQNIVKTVLREPENAAAKDALLKQAKKDPAGVFVQIIRNQKSSYVKEIGIWRMARDEARDVFNPRRVLLTEFYEDLVTDPFIYGIVYNNRILRISNKNFRICDRKTKKTDEDKTSMLDRMWFNMFVKYAMESRFYGHSLVYFYEWAGAEVKKTELVYRDHVIPDWNIIVQRPYDSTGIDFTQPPFNNYMIGIGHSNDLGLFEKAAVHYVLKKHSWRSWDEFEEIFGIPFRYVKTASQDKKVQQEIVSWLESMGSAGYGMFPADSEFVLAENNRTDAFRIFSEKIKLANEELEVLFTGQNRITQKGGAYAKEKVMQEEGDEVTEDDKTFIYHVINDELLPLLRRNGYQFGENDIFEWDDAINEKPSERIDIFTQINSMGYDIEQEQIEAEFGVKITGKRKVQIATSPLDPKKRKDAPEDSSRSSLISMHQKIQDLYVH